MKSLATDATSALSRGAPLWNRGLSAVAGKLPIALNFPSEKIGYGKLSEKARRNEERKESACRRGQSDAATRAVGDAQESRDCEEETPAGM